MLNGVQFFNVQFDLDFAASARIDKFCELDNSFKVENVDLVHAFIFENG